MEESIRAVMKEIDDHGGFVEALRQGYVQQRIAQRAYEHQRAVEKGEVTVVGVNKFRTVGEAHAEPEMEISKASPAAARDAAERGGKVRAGRDAAAAAKALPALSPPPIVHAQLHPPIPPT